MAIELTSIPANANPADYNRVVRFELTIKFAGSEPAVSTLDVTCESAAVAKARDIRNTLSAMPTFRGASLQRTVRYVFEPYCAEKHSNVEC